ncbi:hypothetical protein EB796_010260 [Bugula neritina]|uniref:Fibronectin type-III domain-containing protein n=1 Tax=Bugula neritina TaxID=10212 RepID=A0A7J7JZV0_BUGNE|nr:hypothetical protein EB796_010260 [Bugula neritina]
MFPALIVPSDVVPTKANPSGTNITLEWTYNDTHIVSGFRLNCIPAVGLCGDRDSPLDIPDKTVRTYTHQGATPGQDYNVSIQAYVNTTSDSVQSGWVEFDTVKLVINIDLKPLTEIAMRCNDLSCSSFNIILH